MALQDRIRDLSLADQAVRGLSGRLEANQRRQKSQQRKLDQLLNKAAEVSEQLKQQQAIVTTMEKQIGEIDLKVAKHREQMNTVTSNKEYSALLVEMNTLKVEKTKIEEKMLVEMERLEELKNQAAELDEQSGNHKKLVQKAEADVIEAREEVGVKLDEAIAEREKATIDIPPDVLTMFERLGESYEGEAVAPIEEQDRRRREYNCGGCFMSLPVEIINGLIMRRDEVITCPSCRRILYIKQDLMQAIGAKGG
ncbi:zinc ribbon domain-containing protein [Mucisphaera calidilacus]|uniref:Zinc ribbon domain protein n=1 Tax=Mucisphaera calidilacus TaxID=2527982 RepID=A0A518BY26_9BACT|nr:C4-type zinc ribbon domain-containing protein [Mucisphaera calidilacus]QDU71887.1 Putative zinc ribbon domain protein [Mucisphaera calidilacus]